MAQLEKNESTLSKGNLIRGGLMGYGPEGEGLGYEGSDGGKSMIKKRHYPECDNEIVMNLFLRLLAF